MRLTPSFKGLRPSSAQSSQALSGSKPADTRCERLLRKELWKMGLRFRKDFRDLPGRPDIVFIRECVVVFCDGDFWHGRNWATRKRKLQAGSNSSYWVAKIQTNIDRDKRHNKQLRKLGWRVLRIWESDIFANPSKSAMKIAQIVFSARQFA